ncbi:MAG: polyprenyl synthetase family protein [Candidatus Omnitrophica bacterium]|nr:polyprenyl synthetase family protein [Candidatus Omnitrophota bacterium]
MIQSKKNLSLREIYHPIEFLLDQIPAALMNILATKNDLTREVIRYFFSRSGKMLRPALCLMGAQFGRSETSCVLRIASSLEILHSATLIHDDIIDSSFMRRNFPTVNAKWGPQLAVLVGDFMYDKAFSTIFSSQRQDLIGLFLSTAGTVCDGEILEYREKDNFDLKEAQYLEIIEKKTASLFSACVESGGLLAGITAEQVAALSRYGLYLGLAFQIVDDCLDFAGDTESFGKTVGLDASGGVLTLPVIRLLSLVSENKKSEVFKIFKSQSDPDKLQGLLHMILEHRTIEYALAKACEFTEKARLELIVLPQIPVRNSLELLLDYALERVR